VTSSKITICTQILIWKSNQSVVFTTVGTKGLEALRPLAFFALHIDARKVVTACLR